MVFEIPALSYSKDALSPLISSETLDFHYGKHHQAYVNNLNKLAAGTKWAEMSLEEVIRGSEGGLFNNAAQVFNHSFYWKCLSPTGGGEPTGSVAEAICGVFGSFSDFKSKFSAAAAGHFGSGWAWLVVGSDGNLAIQTTVNAGCPLTHGCTPVLTCDVWEHAYYIDYRNARPKYIEAFWNLVNWDFVSECL